MIKSVVSGSNGFIGRHLVERLENEGHAVDRLDRELLLNAHTLAKHVQIQNPDYIFHLASYGNHHTQQDPEEIFITNVFKTFNLLRAGTYASKMKGFVNFSTSSVYGRRDTEMSELDVLRPESAYACTKAAGEDICRMFAENFKVVTVRPFSVYGPGEDENRFIPKVIESVTQGTGIPLDRKPVHDWIYISDFIDGVMTVFNNMEGLNGDAVNIGTGEQHSNEEVVQILEDIAGKRGKYLDATKRDFDTVNWRANPAILLSMGWTPKHSLEEGLEETFNHYKRLNEKN